MIRGNLGFNFEEISVPWQHASDVNLGSNRERSPRERFDIPGGGLEGLRPVGHTSHRAQPGLYAGAVPF